MSSQNNDSHNEIGGYFGFGISLNYSFPYEKAYSFNTARSAFFVLLKQLKVKSILMPRFICNSMLKPLLMLNIDIQFYQIDDNFYPILPNNLNKDTFLLYVNYFGVCTANQAKLVLEYPVDRLIFDNSQAFFVQPFDNIHTIYSPRKFLPVADGGFLITDEYINKVKSRYSCICVDDLAQYQHLFKRLIYGAKAGYVDFQETERTLNEKIPDAISPITEKILGTIDYTSLQEKRLKNFLFLHEILGENNELSIDISDVTSPLTYPFIYKKSERFTDKLIENNIYSPVYWTDCLERLDESMVEYSIIKHTTHLICDHRYGLLEMERQVKLIGSYLS